MNNEQILKKAIRKIGWEKDILGEDYVREFIEERKWYPAIFSHDFAKAFWGKEKIRTYYCWGCNTGEVQRRHTGCQCQYMLAWQYHLQQLVLKEEPLKYIKKFL